MKKIRIMCFCCGEAHTVAKKDLVRVGYGRKRHLLEIKGRYYAFKCYKCGRQIPVDKNRFK